MQKTFGLKKSLGLLIALVLSLGMLTASAFAAIWQHYPALGASSGGVFTFTQGENSVTLGSEGDVKAFKGISIGAYVLSSNVYVVSGDACNITVSGNYLSAFEPGDYSVRMIFTGGETSATLQILAADKAADAAEAEPDATPEAKPEADAEVKPESKPTEPPMLEGGAEAPEKPADPAASPQQNLINTGLNTALLGLLALSAGGAILFGLSRKWLSV